MGQRVRRAKRRHRQEQAATRSRAAGAAKHAEFVATLPSRLAELEASQAQRLTELKKLLQTVNPLELMAVVAFTYGEQGSETSPAFREYLLGAVASASSPGTTEPSLEDAALAYALAEEIVNGKGMLDTLKGVAEEKRDPLDRLAFALRAQTLWVRGDSYAVHEESLIRRIFQPHDQWFAANSLPSTDEFLASVSEIYRRQIEQQFDFWRQAKVDSERSNPSAMLRALDVTASCATESLARMVVTDAEPRDFGSAQPTVNTELSGRPLIRKDGTIYCFDRRMLAGARRVALESQISTDKRYYEKTFPRKRGQVAEDMTAEAFSKLLPGARIVRGLYYHVDTEDGQRQRCELDMLIHLDDRLFLVEVKGGAVSAAAARGAPKRVQRTLEDLVDEPYRQAMRARAHMDAANRADCFEDASGAVISGLPSIAAVRGIYIVTVALHDLTPATTQLNTLRDLKLIEGKDWPWAVALNDLRVISEVLQSPAEFVLYLDRRARINEQAIFSTVDELDYLGQFLSNGLYFDAGEFGASSRVMLGGFTEDLDRFYGELPGERGECPRFPVSDWYRAFVSSIEACRASGRTEAAKMLLSLDGQGQRQIETMVARSRQQVLDDGKPHEVTVVGGEFGGICIAFTQQLDERFRRARRSYAEMKRHQLRLPRFVVLMQEISEADREPEVDIIEGEPSDPAALDEAVRLFSRARVLVERKAGRNDPCPCNSGRKFKKCCLNQ